MKIAIDAMIEVIPTVGVPLAFLGYTSQQPGHDITLKLICGEQAVL